jgi:hypothetical protein
MANFNKGDWVQITPIPDKKWRRWSNNPEYYGNFTGKIGTIEEIDEEMSSPGPVLYKIKVEFDDYIEDGYTKLPPGKYSEWFKADHLIKSSQYEADRKKSRLKAAQELQEWEQFKKKSTNDALKHVFAPEPKKKEDTSSQWDLKTDPTWYPDYDYNVKDEYYDTNMLDFLNPNDPNFYSDD